MPQVLAFPLDEPWECPRCGKFDTYGTRRSLWSLLPFVCRHLVVGFKPSSSPLFNEQLEVVEVDHFVPSVEIGRRARLRQRLKDELDGRRRFWWAPLTRAERLERRQFQHELEAWRRSF